MPIYEYECQACGETSEAIQKFSDAPLTTCGRCGGALKKLVSQSSFHLKGTGWYVTDYAGKKAGSASKDSGDKKESKKKAGPAASPCASGASCAKSAD